MLGRATGRARSKQNTTINQVRSKSISGQATLNRRHDFKELSDGRVRSKRYKIISHVRINFVIGQTILKNKRCQAVLAEIESKQG